MLEMTKKQIQIVEMLLTGATRDAIPATKREIQEAEDRYFDVDNRPEFDFNIDEWTDYMRGTRKILH